MIKIFTFAALSALVVAMPAAAQQDAADLKSYTTSWEENGSVYRSVMFPHEIEGCKVMLQSIQDMHGVFVERTGRDCDCDLVIDEMAHLFRPASGYTAEKLSAICYGPAVPGNTRKAEIMRESLKRHPDFAKMERVAPLARAEIAPGEAVLPTVEDEFVMNPPQQQERKLRY